MEINEGSWLYKVAYGFNDNKPEQGNLCSFFWKFVFMLFIIWPVFLIIAAVVATSVSVTGFFFAQRSTLLDLANRNRFLYVPYRKWPTIKRHRILPVYFVLLAAAAYLVPTLLIPIATSSITWMVVGGIALVVAVVAGYRRLETAETYQLFKDYVAAKKARVCPIIKFTRKAKTTS